MTVTAIAELSDVKTYLRIPNPTAAGPDDAVLQYLMDAATQAIEREIGVVVPRTVSAERHSGGDIMIWLRVLPVLCVQSVEEGWGYYNWELDRQTVNTQPALSLWSYSLDMPEQGLVTRRGPGNVAYPFVCGLDNIRVDYVAGRHAVPPAARLAFLELVAFWYRNSQLRTSNAPPTAFGQLNADYARGSGESSVNLGVPESVLEMLKGAGRRRPVIG